MGVSALELDMFKEKNIKKLANNFDPIIFMIYLYVFLTASQPTCSGNNSMHISTY